MLLGCSVYIIELTMLQYFDGLIGLRFRQSVDKLDNTHVYI